MSSLNPDQILELRQLVRRHRVFYDVLPEVNLLTGHRVTIGYNLELFGTHEDRPPGVLPGCPRCQGVWDDLRSIAEAVLPRFPAACDFDISAFDHGLHTTTLTGPRPRDDVRLVVAIRHVEHFLDPVSTCEDRCLRQLIADLHVLGVQDGSWSEALAHRHDTVVSHL